MDQGAQAVGMGAEAQTVPAAAELFKKANDILGSVNYHNFNFSVCYSQIIHGFGGSGC